MICRMPSNEGTMVTMAEKEAAERAVKEPNPIIDGRKANVNLAFLGAKPRANVQPLNSNLITDLYTGFPLCQTTAALRAYNPAAALLQAAAVQHYTTAAAGINPYLSPYQPYLNPATNAAATLTAAQTAALLQGQHAAVPQSLPAPQATTTAQASTTPAVGGAGQAGLYYDYQTGQMGASDGYIPYYPYLNLSYNAAAAAAAASQDRL